MLKFQGLNRKNGVDVRRGTHFRLFTFQNQPEPFPRTDRGGKITEIPDGQSRGLGIQRKISPKNKDEIPKILG